MRTCGKHTIEDPATFKKRLLQWSREFEEVMWLDSNDHSPKHSSYDAVLAVEAFTAIQTDHVQAFDKLQEYQSLTKDWIFGYLTYDLKNDTEDLVSQNFDGLEFPGLYFFQPKKIFFLKGDVLEMQYLRMVDDEMQGDLEEIGKLRPVKDALVSREPIPLSARIPRSRYLEKVGRMLEHIQRGDIYEANFCQEFFAEGVELDALAAYQRLNALSNPPFATFLRSGEHFLCSASPERYLRKAGRNLLSQPIKGTARRSGDPEEDRELVRVLEADPKERSENIMIVDLVRNDLSRTAKKGSVEVEELCQVYTYQQVHQMISTVKAVLEEGIPAVEALRSTFPMGSMTGAPKVSAMKIIEDLEETRRGLYSGAVGYFTPKSDFDFNVVIRSILYNRSRKYVSTSVGGAITAGSIPEKEYEECLLKVEAMRQVLEGR